MSAEIRETLRLVGDVGGTNVRFALSDLADGAPRLVDARSYVCADFPSLEAAIDHYLAGGAGEARPAAAVIAVAGPVASGAAELTNGRWRMSETALLARGFVEARLLNDYAALAYSVGRLGADDLGWIGPERVSPRGTALIVGAGTGLGVGALVRDGSGEAVAVTEGGHVAFAPGDETELQILRHLSGRFGRVSLERVLSGPGLVNLRWALARIAGTDVQPMEPGQIVEAATRGNDPLCAATLERFCAIYGAAAGDFALATGATGGVYLGGGIAPKIAGHLRRGAFRDRFEAKGRLAGYVGGIATRIILHPHAALLGAAALSLAHVSDARPPSLLGARPQA